MLKSLPPSIGSQRLLTMCLTVMMVYTAMPRSFVTLVMEFRDAWHEVDGEQVLHCWKPHFKIAGCVQSSLWKHPDCKSRQESRTLPTLLIKSHGIASPTLVEEQVTTFLVICSMSI